MAVADQIRRPYHLAALHADRQFRPHLGIDPHPVLGQDADVFAEPVRLDGDVALQRLGDLAQYRPHIQVQRRALVVGQEFARETEAEGLLAADSHRRQRVGLVGQPEPVCRASS